MPWAPPGWRRRLKVMVRQTAPGLLTAVLLAFGRGIGDAASVLFTAGYTDRLPDSLLSPAASLPLAVFFQLGTPFPAVQERAYASALVLTVIVLGLSLISRRLAGRLTKTRDPVGGEKACRRPQIRIQDLNVWYGSEQALKGITADIPARRITAIIGPSGCGKTTLLRSLNRLLEEADGTRVTGQVWLDGMDIYGRGVDVTEVRTRVGHAGAQALSPAHVHL